MAALATETITSMTSIFTPASSCVSSWTFEGSNYNSVSGGLLLQNLNYGDFDTACFPPEFGEYGRAPSSIQVYSPGACPSGYGTPGVQNFDGTTTLTCCPNSFSYGSTYSSINNFGSSSVLFMGCISSFSGTTVVPARSGDSDLSTTTIYATGAPITMWGQPITVEYQQKDLSLFGSATSSTSAPGSTNSNTASLNLGGSGNGNGGSTTGSAGGSSNTSSAPSSSPSSASSGLSTGAKAGIGIGCAVLAIAVIGLAAFFILKRRKNNRLSPPNYDESKEPYRKSGIDVAELPQAQYERRELDGNETQVYPENGLPVPGGLKAGRTGGGGYDGRTYELE